MPPRLQHISISTQSEVENVLPDKANILDFAFSLRANLIHVPYSSLHLNAQTSERKTAKLSRTSMSAGRPAGRR